VRRKLRDKAKYNEDVARHFEAKLGATSKTGSNLPLAASATEECCHPVNGA
jgi:hypothetical protein